MRFSWIEAEWPRKLLEHYSTFSNISSLQVSQIQKKKTYFKVTCILILDSDFFSEVGKQQFLDAGGLECLREFSNKSIFDDSRWDRLLYRACTVLCKVCEAKTLPVESEMSPVKFNIPDGHLILPEGKLKTTAKMANSLTQNFRRIQLLLSAR